MKSKIALAFDKCKKLKRPALITYTVAGDSTKNNSLKILNKISKSFENEFDAKHSENRQTKIKFLITDINRNSS